MKYPRGWNENIPGKGMKKHWGWNENTQGKEMKKRQAKK